MMRTDQPSSGSTQMERYETPSIRIISASLMQHAPHREPPPCRREIGGDLAVEPFTHQRGAFVVQSSAAHVDRLDALRMPFLHRLDVAVHQQVIVLHQPTKWTESQADHDQGRPAAAPD